MSHIHKYEDFQERGCTDDKLFIICECGKYEEKVE